MCSRTRCLIGILYRLGGQSYLDRPEDRAPRPGAIHGRSRNMQGHVITATNLGITPCTTSAMKCAQIAEISP